VFEDKTVLRLSTGNANSFNQRNLIVTMTGKYNQNKVFNDWSNKSKWRLRISLGFSIGIGLGGFAIMSNC
jgi:hypothetical protein